MQPSNNETVSELVIQNESLTQTLNRFLKKHFNETIIEDTYQNRLFLARQQRRLLMKKRIRYIVLFAGLGLLLRLVCHELVKRYPDFFKEDLQNPEKEIQIRKIMQEILQKLRGGALVEISFKLSLNLLQFVFKKIVLKIDGITLAQALELLYRALIGGSVYHLFLGMDMQERTDLLSNALPELSTQLVPIATENQLVRAVKQLDRGCGNTFHYLFRLILNEDMSEELKVEYVNDVIKHLDWSSSYSAITISCIGLILAILFFVQSSGFFIILKAIIKAIREGKISKVKTLALNYLPRRSPSKYCRRFITFHN
jgi:hypothetical protein